jgi:hypothetical protein
MPLHIFLGDEVLLYFIVPVEVIEIQIWLELKLVCNLQKVLKNYKGFSNFLGNMGRIPAGLAWPSFPPVTRGLVDLLPRATDDPAGQRSRPSQ